jgi:outer membrane receptor protein involved in Fe transport
LRSVKETGNPIRSWLLLFLCAWLVVVSIGSLPAAAGELPSTDETMLMFVGEPLAVVTAASRHPESPAAAPAVVTIVDQKEIANRAYQTLADLLADQPGFFMAPGAKGTVPYLRGIPDGLLILYDGVPLTMEIAKNQHPLDRELSLSTIKRVEIIRGPGSVLWGPDAFAGIINVVPLSGRDISGGHVAGMVGSDNLRGGYGALGLAGKNWDFFASLANSKESYYDSDFQQQKSETGSGLSTIDDSVSPSHYLEATANAHLGNWLTLSGRFSDFKRRYTLHDLGSLSWRGERETPVSFIRATISQTIGAGHLSLNSYYQKVRYLETDVDLGREQKNNIYYGELVWDQRLGKSGLLTLGASLRENRVSGALVSGGFLPDFLKPENDIFVPTIEQADYNTHLWSAYTQYRHHLGPLDVWLGARLDDHSRYHQTFSYSLGANWMINDAWRLKAVGGTAYRSPYPGQIYGHDSNDPEQITTTSLQLAWNGKHETRTALTLFYNRLVDHVQDDPYGGLSSPSRQKLAGAELETTIHLTPTLKLITNASVHQQWGEDIDYRILKATFIRPDGTFEKIYETWDQPFDDGPSWTAQAGILWQLRPQATLSTSMNWASHRHHSYDKDTADRTYHQPLLLNLSLNVQDLLLPGSTLTIRARNLFDQHYRQAGRYGSVEGWPLSISAELGWQF